MDADDLSSSALSAPAMPPLGRTALSRPALAALGERVAARTWSMGLRRWFWGEGVCLLGMLRLADATGTDRRVEVRRWVDAHLRSHGPVVHVNSLPPATAAVVADTDGRLLGAVRPLADWVMDPRSASRAANGALEHWPGSVWVDTMFMAGTFLAHYGAAVGDPDIVNESGRQLVAHAQLLQDERSGLFAHGSHRGEPIWCFWGRGNAWAALSAVEFLEVAAHTSADSGLVEEVRDRLVRQLEALAPLQPEHGVWDVLVDGQPENAGILETSAAAGLAAAMIRAGQVVPDLPTQIRETGLRAARGSLAYVDATGTLTRVSAGTVLQLVPFGYSVIRDDRIQPWGQGLALHAIAAAYRHCSVSDDEGITP